ncbi:hypothetical protein KDH_68170 [Dictyobacter sp. S3.2.2.5]|uniref:Uncharacterized protein n=1 Tax=Dictyobacter halimunensis TaxID=3026934 RepID=A0ABQ6G5D9_9CHLR|nr:hypothetical protein KDH_68170 [Dictyobacter sp. S3.2.2.5]
MNIIKAVYNFIVGDMVILIGVLVLLAVLLLINNVAALASIRVITGPLLIVALLAILITTLLREIKPRG